MSSKSPVTAEADPWRTVGIPALLTLFLACVAAAEQVGSAWQIALSVREAHDATEAVADAGGPGRGRSIALGLVGLLSGGLLLLLVRSAARADREAGRFEIPAGIALVLWVAWIVLGPVLGDDAKPATWLLVFAHWGAAVLATASIALLAHAFLKDLAAAWEHVSVIRLQLVLLVALLVVVVFAPLTSDQMTDVLRAWTDGPANRALAGLAAALLLGAVARTSVGRLLRDAAEAEPNPPVSAPGWKRWVLAGGALVLAVGLWCADPHARVGAGVALAFAAIAVLTRRTEPLRPRDGKGLAPGPIGGVVALLPLAMLYLGLAAATAQSFLVGDHAWTLLGFAVLAGLLFALGCGLATANPVRGQRRAWQTVVCAALSAGCVLPFLLVPSDDPSNWFALAAVPLILLATIVAGWAAWREDELAFGAGGGAAAGATVVVYADPIAGADALGTFALVLLAATGVLLLLHLAGAAGMRNAPLCGLGKCWLIPSRVPVATLLAAWIGVATFAAVGTAHRARVLAETRTPAPTLKTAVGDWLARFGPNPPERLPMLLVAASGGGSKAAYWTDLVLDCLLSTDVPTGDECHKPAPTLRQRARSIALTSSVSGGSVGIYHYLVHPGAGGPDAWLDDSVGREVLSPITGWAAFHDAPAFLLGLDRDPNECTTVRSCRVNADRALVQEAAVADYKHDIVPPENDPERSVVQALSTPREDLPIPVFNGTVNGGGGRVLMSPVGLASLRPAGCDQAAEEDRPGAGSVDAYDYLKTGTDLPLATAALLSARFPVIAPPGRLSDAQDDTIQHCDAAAPLPPIDVRDGGYMENTGLLTITELLPTIQDAIREWNPTHPQTDVQIIVLAIDDDPVVLSADPRLHDPGAAPLSIAQKAGAGYLSQLARDRLTSCQYPDVTYQRISPKPHGGATAATGWEVSATARRRDLVAALDDPGDDAYRVLSAVRETLDGAAPAKRCGPTTGTKAGP